MCSSFKTYIQSKIRGHLSSLQVCSSGIAPGGDSHQTEFSEINCRSPAGDVVGQYLITRSVWCRQDGTSSNEPCQHPVLNVNHADNFHLFFFQNKYSILAISWCRQDGTSSNEPCQHLNVIHADPSQAETQVRCTGKADNMGLISVRNTCVILSFL